MNFLDLCKKLQDKAGVNGAEIAAVTGQVGVLKRIVGWVADAWEDIQGSQDWWAFLTKSSTATLIVAKNNYWVTNLLPDNFNYFWENTLFLKLESTLVTQINFMEWEDYTSNYLHEELKSGTPSYVTISPTGELLFDTMPDKAYTFHFDYIIKKETLAANLDIPTLPDDFHDVIWRKALVSYGEHYGAPEVYQSASHYLEERLQIMENRYLPKVAFRDNVYASESF